MKRLNYKDSAIVMRVEEDNSILFQETYVMDKKDTGFWNGSTNGLNFKKAVLKEFKSGMYVFRDQCIYVRQDKIVYVIMIQDSSRINWDTIKKVREKRISLHPI